MFLTMPIIGVDEPSVVKENLVQVCYQKVGSTHITKHIMKVLVTCQSRALIWHHSRNLP